MTKNRKLILYSNIKCATNKLNKSYPYNLLRTLTVIIINFVVFVGRRSKIIRPLVNCPEIFKGLLFGKFNDIFEDGKKKKENCSTQKYSNSFSNIVPYRYSKSRLSSINSYGPSGNKLNNYLKKFPYII